MNVPGKRYDFRTGRRWQKTAKAAVARARGICHWCGGQATEGDHVVPVTRGGAWFDNSNVVASCRSCNASKGKGSRPVPRVIGSRELIGFGRGWAPLRGNYSRKRR